MTHPYGPFRGMKSLTTRVQLYLSILPTQTLPSKHPPREVTEDEKGKLREAPGSVGVSCAPWGQWPPRPPESSSGPPQTGAERGRGAGSAESRPEGGGCCAQAITGAKLLRVFECGHHTCWGWEVAGGAWYGSGRRPGPAQAPPRGPSVVSRTHGCQALGFPPLADSGPCGPDQDAEAVSSRSWGSGVVRNARMGARVSLFTASVLQH